jgi:hypothetical protein
MTTKKEQTKKAPEKKVPTKKSSTKKAPEKKVPKTLFGMQIRHNPKAHNFSVAMAMVGLNTDIPSADLILRLFDKINEMGGSFDISNAVDLRTEVMEQYDTIKEQFENQKK